MLSFKQFLIEETSSPLQITLTFHCDDNYLWQLIPVEIRKTLDGTNDEESEIRQKLKDIIAESCNWKLEFLNVNGGEIAITCGVDNLHINQAEIDEFIMKFKKATGDSYNKLAMIFSRYMLRCYGDLPDNCFIDVDMFEIDLGRTNKGVAKEISLHDIHKKLNCKVLIIFMIKNVKDSALGILKIKNLEIFKPSILEARPEWYNIINKHLLSKDILSCHEELVDNGFEDYAQL